MLAKQGRVVFGVDMKIVGDDGHELPHDGVAFGDLLVRGPWVVRDYFRAPTPGELTADGWFRTGDVATIDPAGFMQITDRSKDVIKSGGEWISSIDLENLAVAHPAVAEAAVIGVPSARWSERPLLIVVRRPGMDVSKSRKCWPFSKAKWPNSASPTPWNSWSSCPTRPPASSSKPSCARTSRAIRWRKAGFWLLVSGCWLMFY